jgi:hypothetical protein
LSENFTPSDLQANQFEDAYDDVVANANEVGELFIIDFTSE